jgi:deazaflavin-dependent oxidoreductase (nitroreductase family)
MPIPKIVGRLNRVVTNRVTGLFAGRVPGFGLIVHQGRRSGRQYRTPVNVFRVPRGYLVALTYGPDSDWVKNVLAAKGCILEVRGHRVRLVDARIVHDESRREVPPIVRVILGILAVTDFLHLACESTEPEHD